MWHNQIYKILHNKGNHRKKKKKTTYRMGEIAANNATNKGLISKIYKFIQLNSQKKKKKKKTLQFLLWLSRNEQE